MKLIGNLTSKDKEGKILINGEFKICNIASRCAGSSCSESCLINIMIKRLYELEHKNEKGKIKTPENRISKSWQ